jgi:hypothetical protein
MVSPIEAAIDRSAPLERGINQRRKAVWYYVFHRWMMKHWTSRSSTIDLPRICQSFRFQDAQGNSGNLRIGGICSRSPFSSPNCSKNDRSSLNKIARHSNYRSHFPFPDRFCHNPEPNCCKNRSICGKGRSHYDFGHRIYCKGK